MKMRKDKDFVSFFDEKTGQYVRSGIIKNGVESAEDPFMACFPELLDIGIMGHCKHGQSGLCLEAGVECYQDGLHARAPNMTLEDFQEIVRQCRGKHLSNRTGRLWRPRPTRTLCGNPGCLPERWHRAELHYLGPWVKF